MKRALLILLPIPFWACFALAKLAPPEMTTFNKTCPAPKICAAIATALEKCNRGVNNSCDDFLEKLRSAFPEYDCQSAEDAKYKRPVIVPALSLCPERDEFYQLLSELKSSKAREVSKSEELKNIRKEDAAAAQALEPAKPLDKTTEH